ncbi:Molybdenum cofactor sulfurase, partial [Globisporangium splendens]
MASPLLTHARLGSRCLQFIFSLFALAFTAGGFRSYDSKSLGGSASTFTILMTYSAMMFSLWALVAVEIYQYVPRPQVMTERVIDGVFAVVLLIAGIVFAASDYVDSCDDFGDSLRCGNLKAGVVFTFLAMVAFLITLGLNFLGITTTTTTTTYTIQEQVVVEPAPYHIEATPTGALSPIGTTKSPSANVHCSTLRCRVTATRTPAAAAPYDPVEATYNTNSLKPLTALKSAEEDERKPAQRHSGIGATTHTQDQDPKRLSVKSEDPEAKHHGDGTWRIESADVLAVPAAALSAIRVLADRADHALSGVRGVVVLWLHEYARQQPDHLHDAHDVHGLCVRALVLAIYLPAQHVPASAAVLRAAHGFPDGRAAADRRDRAAFIRTSVVFTFLAMASFLLTLLLSFFDRGKDRDDINDDRHHMAAARNSEGPAPVLYHAKSTPTARGDNDVAARV